MDRKKWRTRIIVLIFFIAIILVAYYFMPLAVYRVAAMYNHNHRMNIINSKKGKTERNYYLSTSGDDNKDGKTIGSAWKSIDKLNWVEFNPGDSILFEGGQSFTGNLKLDERDIGTKEKPLYVGSFGPQKATIIANDGTAITHTNGEFIHFSKFILKGNGATVNRGSGLAILNSMRGDITLSGIQIDSVEAYGFRNCGILVEGKRNKSGFRDVTIAYCSVHDNGDAGLYVKAAFSLKEHGYSHKNVYINNVHAYNNTGITESKTNTGSGIVVSATEKGLVENCVAYNNGSLCASIIGGPVGIWAWDAKDIIIQHNESYNNKTNGPYDGGGFDLDGGSVNCVLQYNYSHDNEGSGLFLAQFYWARKHTGNIIRFNVSENDGRKNGYGGIDVWGEVENAYVYNNTVLLNQSTHDTSRAVLIRPNVEMGYSKMRVPNNITIANNILVTSGNTFLVYTKNQPPTIKLINNNYYSTTSTPLIRWDGKSYTSVENWIQSTTQEKKGDRVYASLLDPQFYGTAPDSGSRKDFQRLTLKANSNLIDKGIDLEKEFRINPADSDFNGVKLPQGQAADLGAFEVPMQNKEQQ